MTPHPLDPQPGAVRPPARACRAVRCALLLMWAGLMLTVASAAADVAGARPPRRVAAVPGSLFLAAGVLLVANLSAAAEDCRRWEGRNRPATGRRATLGHHLVVLKSAAVAGFVGGLLVRLALR